MEIILILFSLFVTKTVAQIPITLFAGFMTGSVIFLVFKSLRTARNKIQSFFKMSGRD